MVWQVFLPVGLCASLPLLRCGEPGLSGGSLSSLIVGGFTRRPLMARRFFQYNMPTWSPLARQRHPPGSAADTQTLETARTTADREVQTLETPPARFHE